MLHLMLRELADSTGTRVLLYVDQLEELYTLVADEDTRRRFMLAICTCTDDAQDPVRAVFTLRDDFLVRLAEGQEAREVLGSVTVIRSPGEELLRDTLSCPLAEVGYRFDDPSLVDDMVAAVGGVAASLPLLQFAALQLWEKRDASTRMLLRSAYDEMGGVAGALARHADGVLGELAPKAQAIARAMVLRLVTPEGTRAIASKSELLGAAGGPSSQAQDILARLVAARLVTTRRGQDPAGGDEVETELELVHESLITTWSTLARWFKQSHADVRVLADVRQAARTWDHQGRPHHGLWLGDVLREARVAVRNSPAPDDAVVKAFLLSGRKRERRQAERRRFLVIGVMATLTVIAAVLANEKREADRQRRRAEERGKQVQTQRAEAELEGARAAYSNGRVLETRAKLRASFEMRESAAARTLWWRLAKDPLRWRSRIGTYAYQVAFAADGQHIAVAGGDHNVHLFEAQTGRSRVLRGHSDQVVSVAFNGDGQRLASGDMVGRVLLWELGSGTAKLSIETKARRIQGLGLTPNGKLVAVGGHAGKLRLFETRRGKLQRTIAAHSGRIFGATFSSDGKRLATAGGDGYARLWDVAAGKQLRQLGSGDRSVRGAAFSPDDKQLATAHDDRICRIWDLGSGKLIRAFQGHSAPVHRVSFSQDGKAIATASADQTVRVWDVASGATLAELPGHEGRATSVSFGPKRFLASGDLAGSVRLWDSANSERARPLGGHSKPLMEADFSPDGRTLATASTDHTIRLWDVASGEVKRVLRGGHGAVRSVRFHPSGKQLASAGAAGVWLFELPSGAAEQLPTGNAAAPQVVRFSPDGKLLASSGYDHVVRVFDLERRLTVSQLEGHTAMVFDLRFDNSGKRIVSASPDGSVRLWDLADGSARIARAEHGGFFGVAFGVHGKAVYSSGNEGVRRWSLDNPSAARRLLRAGRSYRVDAHPDGVRVGAPSADHNSRILSVRDKRFEVVLRGHQGEVNALRFNPDGQLAATASDDLTVRLWQVDDGRPKWRAPALLPGPARLVSHQGWRYLDDARKSFEPSKKWQQRIGRDAAFAELDPPGAVLCLRGYDDTFELWDIKVDKRSFAKKLTGLHAVVAYPGGCAVLAKARPFSIRFWTAKAARPRASAPTARPL